VGQETQDVYPLLVVVDGSDEAEIIFLDVEDGDDAAAVNFYLVSVGEGQPSIGHTVPAGFAGDLFPVK